jgi:hypothetical protein
MTEAEWLAASVVGRLLHICQQVSPDRKLRLFCCACAEELFPADTHPDLRRGLDMAVQMADGTADRATIDHMNELFGSITWVSDFEARGFTGDNMPSALFIQYAVLPRWTQVRRGAVSYLSDYYADADPANCQLGTLALSDIFGNPFRPVALDPSWRTEAVVGLARGMYEARDFAPMPVLADALEDAGCADADILAHCRGDGPHVRGCWVVDLVLGKS